jgi:hypothetical protein
VFLWTFICGVSKERSSNDLCRKYFGPQHRAILRDVDRRSRPNHRKAWENRVAIPLRWLLDPRTLCVGSMSRSPVLTNRHRGHKLVAEVAQTTERLWKTELRSLCDGFHTTKRSILGVRAILRSLLIDNLPLFQPLNARFDSPIL